MEWMTGECTFTVLLTRNPTLYCNNDYSSSMLLQKKKEYICFENKIVHCLDKPRHENTNSETNKGKCLCLLRMHMMTISPHQQATLSNPVRHVNKPGYIINCYQ